MRLPDSPERQRQELEFCSALGGVFFAAKGFAAPESARANARSRELWEQLGSPSDFLAVPYRQSRYHMYRGELDLAQRLNEDLMRIAATIAFEMIGPMPVTVFSRSQAGS